MDNYQNNYNTLTPQIPRVPVPVRVLSIVSTVCGAMGLLFSWCYGGFIVSSIAALITSNIANNKSYGIDYGKYTTMIRTGRITGIIGIIANVLTFIFFILFSILIALEIISECGVL